MKAPRRKLRGNLDRVRCKYVDALVEERVNAHSVSAEARDVVGDLEGGPAVDARSLHPRCLARHVVRHLVLEEDVGAAIAVPDHVELLEVLDEKAVGGP